MAADDRPGEASRYLAYLPAVYREDTAPERPSFLGRFLLAFEEILSGCGDPAPDRQGLEEKVGGVTDPVSGAQTLAGLHRFVEPGPDLPDGLRAPAEFLDWLSGWVAIALRADIAEASRRELVARAVPLYRLRGTKAGLEQMLGIYTVLGAAVDEEPASLQVEVHSTVGVDTIVEGGAPHFFRVLIRVPEPGRVRWYRDLATAIIDREKPAHTFYALDVETPSFQVGVRSTVGVDTLLAFTAD
jgi:phage tail-like protein